MDEVLTGGDGRAMRLDDEVHIVGDEFVQLDEHPYNRRFDKVKKGIQYDSQRSSFLQT